MISHKNFGFWGLLSLIGLSGCMSSGEVLPKDLPELTPCHITVTQDNAPLADASVTLVLIEGNQQWYPGGKTDASGVAELYTNGRYKGAPAGKYKIIVKKLESDPSKLPPAPPETDPGYGAWMEKSQKEVRHSYQTVEKQYTLPTTQYELDVVHGKPADAQVDVGKRVRDRL